MFGSGHVFVLANRLDGIEYVVGEFLNRVIDRSFGVGFRTVIIDSHPAADIEKLDRVIERPDFGIDSRGFFHRVLHAFDVGNLRTDVKMQQIEPVVHSSLFEHAETIQDFRSRQTELGRLPSRGRPLAHPSRIQFRPQSDQWADSGLLRSANEHLQFVQFFDHHHHTLSEAGSHQSQIDKRFILEPVTDQQ
jgi:hypothetical protein